MNCTFLDAIKNLPDKTRLFALELYVRSCGWTFPVPPQRDSHLLRLRKMGLVAFYFDPGDRHMGYFTERGEVLAALAAGPFEPGAVIKEPQGWRKANKKWVKISEIYENTNDPVSIHSRSEGGEGPADRRGCLGKIAFGGVCPMCGQVSPWQQKMDARNREVSEIDRIRQRTDDPNRTDRSGSGGRHELQNKDDAWSVDRIVPGGSGKMPEAEIRKSEQVALWIRRARGEVD